MFGAQLSALVGYDVDTPRHVHAFEIDPACQAELKVHPSGPDCIFDDLACAWNQKLTNKFKQLELQHVPVHVKELLTLAKSGKGIDLTQLRCIKHPNQKCIMNGSHVHFAGTPCIEYSPQQCQRQRGTGPTGKVFASWTAQRLGLDKSLAHLQRKSNPIDLGSIWRDALLFFSRGSRFGLTPDNSGDLVQSRGPGDRKI
eukprot:4369881-Pyramimonas_sp.AAC.1